MDQATQALIQQVGILTQTITATGRDDAKFKQELMDKIEALTVAVQELKEQSKKAKAKE